MKIIVFGASGKVGRLVVQKLLNEGHEVTAFVYGHHPFKTSPNLKVVSGDVHNLEDVDNAIKNSEVVISTLGSWGTKQKDILSSGMGNIIAAMYRHKIKRVVSLTGADAVLPTDKLDLVSRIFHTLLRISPMRKILKDGELHMKLLSDSTLEWTVIRSPIMNERGNPLQKEVRLSKPRFWETIHRQSVADSIVEQIQDNKFLGKAPYIKRSKA